MNDRNDTSHALRALLLVGPLPPPPTGTGVSFSIFCRELERSYPTLELDVVDTSPKSLKTHFRSVSLSTLFRAVRIAGESLWSLRRAERVLVFGTDGFLLTMAPILVAASSLLRRPVHLRAFGGSLDAFRASLGPWRRRLMDWTLTRAEGLSVQTELLRDAFAPLLAERVSMAPGYRYLPEVESEPKVSRDVARPLRVLFVGLVFDKKGVFVLLEALRRLAERGDGAVECDFYGKIYSFAEARFRDEVDRAPRCAYRGVLAPEGVIDTMRGYDAFVFPTFWEGEGHPGVVVESMMAGLPVVSTRFRSIPELVEHEENGLLVPPKDPSALADAIGRLANDESLRQRLAKENWRRRSAHDARRVVPELFRQMGVRV